MVKVALHNGAGSANTSDQWTSIHLLLLTPIRERLLKRRLCTEYAVQKAPSQSDWRLAVVCEMHAGEVSCRLTLAHENEGVVLCGRKCRPAQ